MKKTLTLYEDTSKWYGLCGQTVCDENGVIFNVYNLNECPEDATIGRDLFNAKDFLEAVKYGIELAKQGYTEVEYVIGEAEE